MVPKSQRTLFGWTLAALAALLLGQVFAVVADRPPETAAAQLWSGTAPVRVTGTVIRRETVVEFPSAGDWELAVADGEKVAAGQTLFTEARSQELEDAARQVRLLRTGSSAVKEPIPVQRENLHRTIAAMNTGSEDRRQVLAEQLTGRFMAENPVLDAALFWAERRLKSWQGTAGKMGKAPVSGVFSATVDGLEDILTPETPGTQTTFPVNPAPENAAGRIVTGDTWYYRTELPVSPEVGQTLTLKLENGIFQTVTMMVEWTEPNAEGCLALLSCQSQLAAVSSIRFLSAKLVQDTETGLEIPRRAVCAREGEQGVWCLVGDKTQWKPVTVLKELGETVVVEMDRSTTENLWPGDAVLLDHQEK